MAYVGTSHSKPTFRRLAHSDATGVCHFWNLSQRLRVPASAVLGRVGAVFRYAQVQLASARLTHCMRWLGATRRAHDIAADYARRRTAFGTPIGEHEGVGFMPPTTRWTSIRAVC
jgi:alkylation response protein AidB-like acyl-CoA dehydrogenase